MTNKELRRRYTMLSNMYETDGHNYDDKADKCHALGDYENELYYRKLATESYRDAKTCLEVGDYLIKENANMTLRFLRALQDAIKID